MTEQQQFQEGVLPFIKGNIELSTIPDLPSKEIRVYLSSTHTDMDVERTALTERVYPLLRDYCISKYGLEFHMVDLRWGLKGEMNDNDPDRQLYSTELDECLRTSAGPNFVGLIGNRYGDRPLPASIPAAEFELLIDALRRHRARDTRHARLLDFWYALDENILPPAYILQSRDILKQHDTLQLRSSDGQKQILTWQETKDSMRQLLKRSTNICVEEGSLSKDAVTFYNASDLEHECIDGILHNIDPQNNCLLMIRNIVDLKNYLGYTQAAKFIDVVYDDKDKKAKVDEESESALENLKNDKLLRWLPSDDNVTSMEILWKFDNGVDVLKHSSYVDEFCSDFQEKMLRLIDRLAHSQSSVSNDLPPLITELIAHWQEVQRYCNGFVGRSEALNILQQYVTSNDGKPLVITGLTGAGKSALLSKAAGEAANWLGGNCVTVVRYLGTTHNSFDIRQILHSICMQLGYILGHKMAQLPSSIGDLQICFLKILQEWPADTGLLILLDSLHMLVPQYNAHQLKWLPQNLKENVKLIVTTHPAKHGLLDKLRMEVTKDNEHVLDLPPLTAEEGLEMLDLLLEQRSRCLNEHHRGIVTQALHMCGWPLYIKMLCEDVCRWHSSEEVSIESLPRTVLTYFDHFFEHLEAGHGRVLVSHSLAYITASMTGLSDAEMEDVLSLDELVLNEVLDGSEGTIRRIPPYKWLRLKNQLRPFLVKRQCEGFSVYFWAHRQFVESVKDRYLLEDNSKKEIHSVLADYFLGVWSDKPKPFQRPNTPNNNTINTESRMKCVAFRHVPAQHLTFKSDDGNVTFNKRKYDQVPRHLFLSGRLSELNQCVLFSYEWLYNKTKALSLEHVLADFILNPGVEATLVERALRDAQTYIEKDINILGVELSGRLLTYYKTHENIRHLIQQADKTGLGHCALVPNFPYYQVPGSPLKHVLKTELSATSHTLTGDESRYLMVKAASGSIVQVYDLVLGEHVKDIETSGGDMYVTPSGTRLVIVDHMGEKAIKIHSTENGQFIGQLIPLNHVKMDPKEKYRMGALSVSDTHVAFIVTTDTSYLCVADTGACRFIEVQGLEGRAAVCHLTPDGQYVFTNSNNFVRSYDLYTSERVCNIELEYKPTQIITTDNGQRGFLINGEENKVYVIYLRDGNIEFIYKVVVAEYFPEDTVSCLKLSKNHEQLLVRGDDNLVVYNTVTERVVAHFPRPLDIPREFKLPMSHYTNINFTQADFSPDDKFVVAAIFRHIYIWNISTNRLLTSLQAPVGIIDHLLIPADRGQIITQQRNSNEINVWGLGDAIGHVGMLDRLTNKIEEIKLSHDDKTAFVRCLNSDEIGVLDMNSGQLVDLLTHPSPVTSFSLTPNGKYALVASDPIRPGTANKIWYMDGRKVIYEFGNVGAYSVTLQHENCLIAIEQEEKAFKAPYHIKLYTFEGEQFEECRLSYEVNFMLVEPFVTPADKYLVMLTADDYSEKHALHTNPTICAISLKANMAVSTFSVKDLSETVSMERILSVRPYGNNSYTVIVFYTNESDLNDDATKSRKYIHCYGFMIFDVCSGVVCQVIEDLITPQTKLDHLIFNRDVSLCIDPQSHIYNMANGYFLKRLTEQDLRPRELALGGKAVLYAEGQRILVLRLSDGKELANVDVHSDISCIEVCHDERTLILGCSDGSILSYVLGDISQETPDEILSKIPSRQTAVTQNSSTAAPRSWDKVDSEFIPAYSRPPSAMSIGPSDKHLLKKVKPVPRMRPSSETILYANPRSKVCSVM